MKFSIIYLASNQKPRTTWVLEVEAETSESALGIFINMPEKENMFVAGIVEGENIVVHYALSKVEPVLRLTPAEQGERAGFNE